MTNIYVFVNLINVQISIVVIVDLMSNVFSVSLDMVNSKKMEKTFVNDVMIQIAMTVIIIMTNVSFVRQLTGML